MQSAIISHAERTVPSAVDRFWSRVQKSDGCWLWTGAKTQRGYGVMTLAGSTWLAHRYAWTLVHGSIPDARWVLHRCDNPNCVRVDHLFVGTPRDNREDMYRKGRARHHHGPAPKRGPRPKSWRARPGTSLALKRRYGGPL